MPGDEVMTVLGPRPLGGDVVDAHGHTWIARVAGVSPDAPRLDDEPAIAAELGAFAGAGGAAVVDCQPRGAGRDAAVLVRLAQATGVALVAATGFHLARYHAPGSSPWRMEEAELHEALLADLLEGMDGTPARAGVVKVAHPGHLGEPLRSMLRVAAAAAHAAGVVLVVHTERGGGVEDLAELLAGLDLPVEQVMLCHVDKRPDRELHAELARTGFLLEYDTFLRPKYAPRDGVWPLLDAMLADGHGDSIACGLDLAGAELWRFGGAPHGMLGLTEVVAPELRRRGVAEHDVAALCGATVVRRLVAAGARVGGTRA